MHAYNIAPDSMEKLDPAECNPFDSPPYTSVIPNSKEEAAALHDANISPTRIYCDGSGTKEGMGAAAVLYRGDRPTRKLRYHLGQPDTHTVYEAEAVGLTLAASLLATEPDPTFPVTIFVDNQAVIQSGEHPSTKPGHHIIRKFHSSLSRLRNTTPIDKWQVTLQWLPGHANIPGNELADQEAKKAAEGPQSNSRPNRLPPYLRKNGLPGSISAAIRTQQDLSKKRWYETWIRSPRYKLASKFDAGLLSHTNANLLLTLPKSQTTLYIRLHTGHIGLNKHLFRIKKIDSPACRCGHPQESVLHYLTVCPIYNRARHNLHINLGRKASHAYYLLTAPKARPHLMKFITATKRFAPTNSK